MRLGLKQKDHQNEYDEEPLSQKGAVTPSQRRGNFLDKLNPNFLNKFNEKDQVRNPGRETKGNPKSNKKGNGIESFVSGAENDVSITVVSGKPPDFEYLLEIQRMAEQKYHEQQQEEEERYKGLTPLEKRKQIIAETERLQAKEGQGDKKGTKSAKGEKREQRKKPPKSQRPKWQNVIDDEEGDHKDSLAQQEQQNVRQIQYGQAENPQGSYKIVDSDKEQRDSEGQEDVQIIIKTDKHSKQRSVKDEVFEGGPEHESFNVGNPGQFSSKFEREQSRDHNERERERKHAWKRTEEDYEDTTQQPQKQPAVGISWLSQTKSPAQDDSKGAETASVGHGSMLRSIGHNMPF